MRTKTIKTRTNTARIAKELGKGFKTGWQKGILWSWKHLETESNPVYSATNGTPLQYKEYFVQSQANKEAKRLRALGHPVRVAREWRWFVGGFRTRPDWVWTVYYNPVGKPFGKNWQAARAQLTFPKEPLPPLPHAF